MVTIPPASSPNHDHPRSAAALILLAAASWSTLPMIIHLTATDTNPFIFNAIDQTAMVLLLSVIVIATRRQWNKTHISQVSDTDSFHRPRLLTQGVFFSYLSPASPQELKPITLRTASRSDPMGWFRLPILWVVISGLNIGVYAWSTHYIETAIAAIIYEMRPFFLVIMMMAHYRTHRLFRYGPEAESFELQQPKASRVILTSLATLGLFIMLMSQGESGSRLIGVLSLQGIFGAFLAMVAAALAAANVVASLSFGRIASYRIRRISHAKYPASDLDHEDRHLIIWYTLVGVIGGRVLAAILSSALGISLAGSYGPIELNSITGALILGAVEASVIILIRMGNLLTTEPAVNSISYLAPVLGLMWLMLLGVSLPRFDLFIIGASLILAVNVLLQMEPDKERDFSRFAGDRMRGRRLGFTAFIMSLWAFGTLIYLRDEWLPSRWLSWPTEEYWGLLALATTVFALILGFRVARVTERVSHEDELMFRLFRECEHLEREGLLDSQIRDRLLELDRARPNKLLQAYVGARNMLNEGVKGASSAQGIEPGSSRRLLEAEQLLDMVTHSKQQGRDVVELMSLFAFALVTVRLGLFSRPFELGAPEHAWGGFVAEVFVLLLISTVAFLAINLFDVGRERQMPLLVPVKEQDIDYGLFFRYKRDRAVEHAISILISLTMAVAFAVLLYNKWQ